MKYDFADELRGDEVRAERRSDPTHGSIYFNGSTKLFLWILGLFGTLVTGISLLTLQAVYTSNGEIHELKGQQAVMQQEVTNLVQTQRSGSQNGN